MEAWLENSLQSGWMWWILNSVESEQRKTKSRTEFESWWLSEYLVEKYSVDLESSRWKESAISNKMSLKEDWKEKLESQRWSLILKLPVIRRMLSKLTSVSLKYFKADWDELEYILSKNWIELQLKNNMHEISLWLKMSLWSKKQRNEMRILIYTRTLGKSLVFVGFLKNIIQLKWLGMPTNSLPSQLSGLRIKQIYIQNGFWMKIISESECVLRMKWMMRLFLQKFWEKTLIFSQIMLDYHLQLSKLIYSYFHRFQLVFLNANRN